MNKKQFLLLSLLACTLLPQADTKASTSRLRAVATNTLTFAGLLAGGYTGTGVIIGHNNQNAPVLDEKSNIPTEQIAKHLWEQYRRQNPYTAAFEELNEMIADDYTRLGKVVRDKAALEKAAKNAYAALATAASKAYNKMTCAKPEQKTSDNSKMLENAKK